MTATKTVDQYRLMENRRDFNTNRLVTEPVYLQTGDFYTYMPDGGWHDEYEVIVDTPTFLAIKQQRWACRWSHLPDRYIEVTYHLFRPQEDGTHLLFMTSKSLAPVEFFANGEVGDYVEVDSHHGKFRVFSPEDLAKHLAALESRRELTGERCDFGGNQRLTEWLKAREAGRPYRKNYWDEDDEPRMPITPVMI